MRGGEEGGMQRADGSGSGHARGAAGATSTTSAGSLLVFIGARLKGVKLCFASITLNADTMHSIELGTPYKQGCSDLLTGTMLMSRK
jgi:hypothetical protein